MGNYQAEIDQERRHLEGSINDEYFDPNACGTKTKPQYNQFERERDDNGGGDGERDISPNMSEPGERDHVENLIHLHSLIDELPTESRVIVLLYIEGYNQAETAAKLGISQPKVSRILAAAIEIMRKASA